MLRIKLDGVESALAELDPTVVNRAARASIDRAAKSGAAAATDAVLQKWNVKRSDFKDRLRISPPRMDNLSATITISGRGMSLSYFGAKQIKGNRVMSRKGKDIVTTKLSRKALSAGPVPIGVIVQVIKGKSTALMRNVFFAKTKSSHIGIFRRSGKSSLPIFEKSVISIGHMVEDADTMAAVTSKIEETWATEFPRQLEYFRKK